MTGRDRNLDMQVPEEPEGQRPYGTGEDSTPTLNGLAADPYADDVLMGLRRRGASRLLLEVIILAVIALVLTALILYAGGVWNPQP